ncbi:MAG: hypothetical protein HN793_04425 [Rhodospirillaceae bacterium]|jgi:hypothetical protein|nr:hypothetical protein [Rhodospirillaceae bacterium]MBT5564289.1 hypothetical protein [Rhodospirillaceae bacterium]MBT6088853.1 hypothetical protein [Rhodospirillaceae bacterium]MBT6960111.1 hypothetical protein [Rhodospirillaceae bacterium]MBT7450054.1 hypothetical protein [Rhodospirillaceae bacterium]
MKQGSKSPRSEQQFFDDPAIDRIMGAFMALATEHYVLLDRVRAMERELVNAGTLNRGSLGREPDEVERAETSADRTAFIEALMRPLLGEQEALGAAGKFSLK